MPDTSTVDVVLAYETDLVPGKAAGDRVTVDLILGKKLVRAGYAVYATVPDAKAAGVSPETAATKQT